MAVIQWLEAQLNEEFFPALAQTSEQTQVEHLCQRLIESWQDPGRSEEYIARNLYTTTRKRIRERAEVPKEVKIWALGVVDIPTEQWIVWNERHELALDQRLADPQFIAQPDAVVERARSLLLNLEHLRGEQEWPQVAVGLAICTGRRFAEVMKKAHFEVKTSYSVLFTGPVKRRDEREPLTFEIPTLCEAELVCHATSWLREQIDCSLLNENEVSSLYGKPVRQMTDRQFRDLIPNRAEKTSLYTQICRAVYCALADYYFGPPEVPSLLFREAILGHFQKIGSSGAVRYAYTSAAHYFDYLLLDEQGQPDHRRGTWLGRPGVTPLKVVQDAETLKQMLPSVDEQASQTADEPSPQKKKRSSLLNVTVEDRNLFVDLNTFTLRKRTQSEALRFLIVFFRSHQALASDQQQMKTLSLDELSIDEESRETIRQAMVIAEEDDVLAFLSQAAIQVAKKRVKEAAYWDVDFSQMPTATLLEEKRPGALEEKVRRAVLATMVHNREMQDPKRRWFLNANVVKALVGGRPNTIRDILLATYSQPLEQHHASLRIVQSQNRNPKEAALEIMLPDDPEAYSGARQAELFGSAPTPSTGTVQEK